MPTIFTRSNLLSTKCPHGHGRISACSIAAASGRAQRGPTLLQKCHARLYESRAGRGRSGTCHAEADAGRQHAKAASSLSTVCDVVVLLEATNGVSPAEAEEMIGVIWSAQYLPPGVLCAFAGAQTANSAVPGSSCLAPFTHGVRFRCGDRQKGEAFLASPAVQEALRNEQGRRCSARFSYILEGQVPADLEAIFCRGIEWDHGVEHVLLLKARKGVEGKQIDEHLSQLAALAESSLAGALQCTYGPAKLRDHCGSQEQFQVTHAMLMRCETVQQLQAFLRLSPCSQLLKTSEDPCFASALSFAYDIAPPSRSQSSAPQRNLL